MAISIFSYLNLMQCPLIIIACICICAPVLFVCDLGDVMSHWYYNRVTSRNMASYFSKSNTHAHTHSQTHTMGESTGRKGSLKLGFNSMVGSIFSTIAGLTLTPRNSTRTIIPVNTHTHANTHTNMHTQQRNSGMNSPNSNQSSSIGSSGKRSLSTRTIAQTRSPTTDSLYTKSAHIHTHMHTNTNANMNIYDNKLPKQKSLSKGMTTLTQQNTIDNKQVQTNSHTNPQTLTHTHTHINTHTQTHTQASTAENKKAPCCDKCDGKHETDDCPYYKKPRETHIDAQKNGWKKLTGMKSCVYV